MFYLQSIAVNLLITQLFLIPASVLFHLYRQNSRKETLSGLVFMTYLAAVYFLTGLPTVTYVRFEPNLNWIPFHNLAGNRVDIVLNVFFFLPLGFLLPILWQDFRNFFRTLGFGLGVTLGIELLQIFSGRASDIDDIIANLLGAAAGFLLALIIRRPPLREKNDALLLTALTAGLMFLISPIVEMIYVGLFL